MITYLLLIYEFKKIAKRIGVTEGRIEKLMTPFLKKQPFMETLVSHLFLSEANKRGYLLMYQTKKIFDRINELRIFRNSRLSCFQ